MLKLPSNMFSLQIEPMSLVTAGIMNYIHCSLASAHRKKHFKMCKIKLVSIMQQKEKNVTKEKQSTINDKEITDQINQ